MLYTLLFIIAFVSPRWGLVLTALILLAVFS